MDPNVDPNEPPPPGQGKRVRGPCPGATQSCGQDAAPLPAADHPGNEGRYPCTGPGQCTGREVCGREPTAMIPCPGRGVCGKPKESQPRKRGPCRGPGVCGPEVPEQQDQPEPEKPKRGPCLGPVCGPDSQPEPQPEPEPQEEQERPKRGPCAPGVCSEEPPPPPRQRGPCGGGGGGVCGPGPLERDRSRRGPCPGPVCDTSQAQTQAAAHESAPPDICLRRSFCEGLAVCPDVHPLTPAPPPGMCLRSEMCRDTECAGETTCMGPGARAATCVPCQEGVQQTTNYEGVPQPESQPQPEEQLPHDVMICASVRVQKQMRGEIPMDGFMETMRLGVAGMPAALLCREYGCPVGAGPGEPVPLCEGPGLCDGSKDCPSCYDGPSAVSQPPPPPPPPPGPSDLPCVGLDVCTACGGGGAPSDQGHDADTAPP